MGIAVLSAISKRIVRRSATPDVTFRSEAIPDLTRQLESLIASPDQVVERGEAARLRVSAEYSWSTVTTRMEELYDRVMRQ